MHFFCLSLCCLICGFKTQSWKSSIPLFTLHLEGRLCWLVALSSDDVEAAHGKRPRKRYSATLSRFMNTERYCKDQTE